MIRSDELIIVSSSRAADQVARQGARVETLASLRRRLLSKLAPEVSTASPEASRLAIRAALGTLKTADFTLNGASRARTVEAFDGAIGTLLYAGATADLLERAARTKGAAGKRAATLAHVMRGMETALARAAQIDRRAVARHLATVVENASAEDVAEGLRARRLIARLVVDWQGADLALWRALDSKLARVGGEARVELPMFHKNMDTERERDPLEILIDDVARRLDAAPATVGIAARFGDMRFADDTTTPAGVELHRASNAAAQARAIAHLVQAALRDGVPADRIAIGLADSGSEVIEAITRIFFEIHVPVSAPATSRSVHVPIVRAALDALRFVRDDPSRAELRALAVSPFIAADVEPTLRRARAGAQKQGSWRTRIESARTLFAEFQLAPTATTHVMDVLAKDQARSALSELEVDAHAENARAWAALHAALDAIEAAAVRLAVLDGAVDAAELARALEISLEAPFAASTSARAGSIFVGRLSELGAAPLDLLIIADANEGALPATSAISPVIGDELAGLLRDLDASRSPLPSALGAASSYSALAATAAQSKKIAIIHRAQRSEGDPAGPSALVAWLQRQGMAERAWDAGPLAGEALSARESDLRKLAFQPKNRRFIAPDETRRASTELARERYHSKKISSNEVGDLSGAPSSVDVLTRMVASKDRPLSITALEDFARCAFRGMAKSVLSAREIEQEGETPDARERGKLVHEALRAALAATLELWSARPRDVDRIRSLALDAGAASLRFAADSFSSTRVVLREVVRRQVIEELTRIVDLTLADLTFDPVFVEKSFGQPRDPDGWPALELTANGVALWLQGKIDRVDVMHESRSTVRAVDYKSGLSAAKDAHRDLGKATLQVPLYARAAMVSMGADRAEGLYLPARDIAAALANHPKFEKAWEALGAHEKTRPELAERVLEILKPVHEGRFFPDPPQIRDCDRCAYDGICRRPRFVVTEEEDDEANG